MDVDEGDAGRVDDDGDVDMGVSKGGRGTASARLGRRSRSPKARATARKVMAVVKSIARSRSPGRGGKRTAGGTSGSGRSRSRGRNLTARRGMRAPATEALAVATVTAASSDDEDRQIFPMGVVAKGLHNYQKYLRAKAQAQKRDEVLTKRALGPTPADLLVVKLVSGARQEHTPELLQGYLDARTEGGESVLNAIGDAAVDWWTETLQALKANVNANEEACNDLPPAEKHVIYHSLRLRLPAAALVPELGNVVLYDAFVPFTEAAYNSTNGEGKALATPYNDARPFVMLDRRPVVLLGKDFRAALQKEALGMVNKVVKSLRTVRSGNKLIRKVANTLLGGQQQRVSTLAKTLPKRKFNEEGLEERGGFFGGAEDDEDDYDDVDADELGEDGDDLLGGDSEGGEEGAEGSTEGEEDEEDSKVVASKLRLAKFVQFLGPLGRIVFYAVLGGKEELAAYVYDLDTLYYVFRKYLDNKASRNLEMRARYGKALFSLSTDVTASGRRYDAADRYFDLPKYKGAGGDGGDDGDDGDEGEAGADGGGGSGSADGDLTPEQVEAEKAKALAQNKAAAEESLAKEKQADDQAKAELATEANAAGGRKVVTFQGYHVNTDELQAIEPKLNIQAAIDILSRTPDQPTSEMLLRPENIQARKQSYLSMVGSALAKAGSFVKGLIRRGAAALGAVGGAWLFGSVLSNIGLTSGAVSTITAFLGGFVTSGGIIEVAAGSVVAVAGMATGAVTSALSGAAALGPIASAISYLGITCAASTVALFLTPFLLGVVGIGGYLISAQKKVASAIASNDKIAFEATIDEYLALKRETEARDAQLKDLGLKFDFAGNKFVALDAQNAGAVKVAEAWNSEAFKKVFKPYTADITITAPTAEAVAALGGRSSAYYRRAAREPSHLTPQLAAALMRGENAAARHITPVAWGGRFARNQRRALLTY